MKKNIAILVIINCIMISLSCVFAYNLNTENKLTFTIWFGELHQDSQNVGDIYYSKTDKDFESNEPIEVWFGDNAISFDLTDVDLNNNYLRLDPFNEKKDFSVSEIVVTYGDDKFLSITGRQWVEDYVSLTNNISYQFDGDDVTCSSENDDPQFIMNKDFSIRLYSEIWKHNTLPYILFILVILLMGFIDLYISKKNNDKQIQIKKIYSRLIYIFVSVVLSLGILAIYIFNYLKIYFKDVTIGQIVYHLHTPLDGTNLSSSRNAAILGVALIVCINVILIFVNKYMSKNSIKGHLFWATAVGISLVSFTFIQIYYYYGGKEYYQYTHENSSIYDDYYVDGRDINISFPEKKRNLIYIFLESMEITFADTQSGGAMKSNYIKELTEIAKENECFSGGDGLNGAHQLNGATFTMGALTAQTAGIPINEYLVSNATLNNTWESEDNYFPGAWSIGDILKEEGYNQEFLIGSVGGFAGRSSYFRGHGGYDIEDYDKAIEKKLIPGDYNVWWGYEDEKLFDFAKQDLLKLSKEEEPFNLTMLTVDTHFTDGYLCRLCKNEFDNQYSNVIACASRQVSDFLDWIKQQDFYENTTIVIAGDHLTPDSDYIDAENVGSYDRRAYVAVINANKNKLIDTNRIYTTLDLYPTTVSALGIDFEGNRLGLGVDLYSDEPTLAEKLGVEELNTELLKNSEFYKKKLLYK